MSAAAETTARPFTFDRNYDNTEQVRPYYADYAAVRAEMDAAGRYPYNDDFKGRIASLAGTDDREEDSAIYLLQRMHELDALTVKIADFLASGGVRADDLQEGEIRRGTVVHYGFYMGGTGWQQWEGARLLRTSRGLAVLPKGKRTYGHSLTEGRVLVKVNAR